MRPSIIVLLNTIASSIADAAIDVQSSTNARDPEV